MTEICSHCGQTMPTGAPDAIETLADSMRRWCTSEGYNVTWDDHVTAPVAAILLEKAAGTLANWASYGEGPPFRRAGGKGQRMYSLEGIARFLASEK
jgi:hypothetical protein